MITKTFDTALGKAALVFSPDSVTVVYPPGVEEDTDVCIPWEKLTDVDYIVDAMGMCPVKVFRTVVEQLGYVYANKHIYEALA